MKKTKIICTLGPVSETAEAMTALANEGMDIARFNFSHGSHESQKRKMDILKQVRKDTGKPIAILLDTKGPEIRTGALKNGDKVQLTEGSTFVLSTKEREGDENGVSITYPGLKDDVQEGQLILIDDGLIELSVLKIEGDDIICKVDNGGELGGRKGVNVPNVPVKLPAITDKDKEDIRFGVEQDVDFIAASFVRNAACIHEIRDLLKEYNAPYIPIIAKVENAEGIQNIDEIVQTADAVMVARGDLGVEIPAEQVPYLQKMIIQKCNEHYKPVITATQMLDSMIRNPRPTRAEVGDVANAVYDGTDAVMLSGETANGKYPEEALRMMVHIVETTEKHLDYNILLEKAKDHRGKSISAAIGYASVSTADVLKAKCIITPSVSGATARVVSKFRPRAHIIGVTPEERALRRFQIFWGVIPVASPISDTADDICSKAVELAKENGYVENGDVVIVTAGIPSTNIHAPTTEGASNTMRIVKVESKEA